jgi:hypothetical protein
VRGCLATIIIPIARADGAIKAASDSIAPDGNRFMMSTRQSRF